MPTPEEPGKPHERPVLEPIRVLRPRNTDALAELFREMTELTQDPDAYEAIPLRPEPAEEEAPTEELPPLDRDEATTVGAPAMPRPRGGRDWRTEGVDRDRRTGSGDRDGANRRGTRAGASQRGTRDGAGGSGETRVLPGGSGPGRRADAARGRAGAGAVQGTDAARGRRRAPSGARVRRGAIAVGVCAAALAGFAGALLLPGRGGEAAARTPPPTAAAPTPAATATGSVDPDGAGTLREGDSGAEVTDLQQRLLRIPDVYDDGPTDGRYGTVLTEAVARFQLWYGIRGDESGVYGDDTRRDLEARTASMGG
ncbi:peptidoglycan-binding domain-containing protein [Streptomyces maremycinicus]|uniref:peptidoglycan-binding domain-containing protein n=1 Tax=Streptomyces maremycinicus TaxID=1679753 RepID=UPI000788FDFF|nr:peptidoglycan-binding domain-containing protein [Streptomyces sp. NBRC 110468]